MTRPKVSTLCLVTAALAVATITLRASDPVGVYTLIDKVVLMPNSTEPASAQIFGAFSLAVPRAEDRSQPWPAGSFGTPGTGDVYAAVQRGYLYYTCPRGKEAGCVAEWNDLTSMAGKGQILGFGSRWAATGRVRPATEKLASPDVYPMNIGVVRMGYFGATGLTNRSQYPDLIAALKAASRAK